MYKELHQSLSSYSEHFWCHSEWPWVPTVQHLHKNNKQVSNHAKLSTFLSSKAYFAQTIIKTSPKNGSLKNTSGKMNQNIKRIRKKKKLNGHTIRVESKRDSAEKGCSQNRWEDQNPNTHFGFLKKKMALFFKILRGFWIEFQKCTLSWENSIIWPLGIVQRSPPTKKAWQGVK